MEIPSKILIIRLSSIGDILLTFPTIRALHSDYPETAIDFIISKEYSDILSPIRSMLRNIILYDKTQTRTETHRIRSLIRQEQYPLIIDLHNNLRTRRLARGQRSIIRRFKKHHIRRYLFVRFHWNVFNVPPVWQRYLDTVPLQINRHSPQLPDFCPDENSFRRLKQEIPALSSGRKSILIYPGARHFTKRWPVEYYRELIRLILERTDHYIVLSGSNAEAPDNQRLTAVDPNRITDSSGEYTLSENFALISLCDLIISNDSAPMHMAALLGKPQIAIFGNTVRQFGFYPENPHVIIMEDNSVSCRPCSHIGFAKCPKGHFDCMRKISPESVFRSVRRILS